MPKGGSEVTVSTYYLGVQFLLCQNSIDSLDEVYVDKKQAWTGTVVDNVITIDQPELFGGLTREGGVSGDLAVWSGKVNQELDTYLSRRPIFQPAPAFRGVTTVVLRRMYVGLNYYLKSWTFVCTRIQNQLYGNPQWEAALATIDAGRGLMNPIHMIREMLVSPYFGYGYKTSRIDDIKFKAAAQTLYDEQLGLAFLITSGTVQDFIADVLRHIQAALFQDRTTGKIVINLIREVQNPETLFVINENNSDTISNFTRTSITELVSTVTIEYEDNLTHEKNSVVMSDVALYQRQDTPVEKTLNYPGVATAELARKFAARDLLELSIPLYKGTIEGTKALSVLNIGDAFKLDRPDFIDNPIIMRVLAIDLGNPTTNKVRIQAIEDVFYAATVSYIGGSGAGKWTSPINAPANVVNYAILDAPYYAVAKLKGDTFAQDIAETEGVLMAYGEKPSSDAESAYINVLSGGSYVNEGTLLFCFTAILANNIDKVTTTINFEEDPESMFQTVSDNGFLQIDNEIMDIVSITTTSFTVKRGALDTVPEAHNINSKIYAWGDYAGFAEKLFLVNENLSVKLTTKTPVGVLPIDDATLNNVTIQGRLHMPYPPANVKINDVYWPVSVPTATATAGMTVTWATRDRLQQTLSLIGFYEGDITTEAGVEYFGELRRVDTDAVISSFSNITITSSTFTTTYIGQVKAIIWCERGTWESYQKVIHIFDIV